MQQTAYKKSRDIVSFRELKKLLESYTVLQRGPDT